MYDAEKTKEQLIDELAVLRQRCAALETVLSPSPFRPPGASVGAGRSPLPSPRWSTGPRLVSSCR